MKGYNVMIDEKKDFNQPLKMIYGHMRTFTTLQLFKEMVTQLVVY